MPIYRRTDTALELLRTWAEIKIAAEINDFEEQLTQSGIVLQKFWVQISKEEQLARFKAREDIAYKRHKITDEDWRNRDKWQLYKPAVDEMLRRTSTGYAPWTIVEANDKLWARIKAQDTVINAVASAG